MTARSQLLLYRLFWIGERMLQPTLRNALCSFDEWASRSGLWRDINKLEEEAFLETEAAKNRLDRVVRLTEKGRLAALGGCDPNARWNRGWDGKWRVLLFDIPESERLKREKLRKILRAARFGALQRSAWICPDSLAGMATELRSVVADCGVLMAIEGTTCLGETDSNIVATAWDFNSVAAAYEAWKSHTDSLDMGKGGPGIARLTAWGNRERQLWADCLAMDPLLPRALWPDGYVGEIAWRHRLAILGKAAGVPG